MQALSEHLISSAKNYKELFNVMLSGYNSTLSLLNHTNLGKYFNEKKLFTPPLGTCNDEINNYTCTCDPGYTSYNCSVDIDECQSSPCIHGKLFFYEKDIIW